MSKHRGRLVQGGTGHALCLWTRGPCREGLPTGQMKCFPALLTLLSKTTKINKPTSVLSDATSPTLGKETPVSHRAQVLARRFP